MLQHESQAEPSSTLPGRIRITSEELNQAVAAIENRRQAEAQRLAGTIPIEEAVTSLHLDASYEEIWAEVQTQREAAAQEAATRRQQTLDAQAVTPTDVSHKARNTRQPWKRLVAVGAVFSALWVTGLFPHVGRHSLPKLVPTASLAQIPDGTEVYCDTATLAQISEAEPLSQIRVAQHPGENGWTLIKMGGHVYLHAYSLPIPSLSAQTGKPVILDNDDDSGTLHGERTSQTTLRLDHVPFQVSGGGDDYSEITVPQFQPDQFTTTNEWR